MGTFTVGIKERFRAELGITFNCRFRVGLWLQLGVVLGTRLGVELSADVLYYLDNLCSPT